MSPAEHARELRKTGTEILRRRHREEDGLRYMARLEQKHWVEALARLVRWSTEPDS